MLEGAFGGWGEEVELGCLSVGERLGVGGCFRGLVVGGVWVDVLLCALGGLDRFRISMGAESRDCFAMVCLCRSIACIDRWVYCLKVGAGMSNDLHHPAAITLKFVYAKAHMHHHSETTQLLS